MCKEVLSSASDCVIIKGRTYVVRSIPVRDSATNLNQIVPPNCNSWMVENYGTVTAYVNDKPVLPGPAPGLSGESFRVNGNPGDYYRGEIIISFDPGGGGIIWITYYIYTD